MASRGGSTIADETPFEQFIRSQARKLRENDQPPKDAKEWDTRRKTLRERILANIGPTPEKHCDLEPRNLGTLERDGYRIEKLVFQSRPDVWVTANAFVPTLKDGEKVPAVLCVHGHWAGVPVCSVGNYQAYLRAACCVCEVMPNALTFTEEGDVLGLVAPRALMVVNASRDAIQFSPPEAEKSVGRAKDIFGLLGAPEKLRH